MRTMRWSMLRGRVERSVIGLPMTVLAWLLERAVARSSQGR